MFSTCKNYSPNCFFLFLQLSVNSDRKKSSEKYPSFDLVLNFVRNEALSVARVQALLQQREKMASAVSQTFTFLSEVVRVMGVEYLFEVRSYDMSADHMTFPHSCRDLSYCNKFLPSSDCFQGESVRILKLTNLGQLLFINLNTSFERPPLELLNAYSSFQIIQS